MERRTKVVFVVDDDPGFRKSIALLLSKCGFSAELYPSGEAFLSTVKLTRTRNSCAVVDIQLDGMSGIELATAMTVDRPKLKVLMMSGFPEGMLVLNEGWHFLPRPFVASQMRTLVTGLLVPDKKSRFAAPATTE